MKSLLLQGGFYAYFSGLNDLPIAGNMGRLAKN